MIFLLLFPFSWQGFSHFSPDYQAEEWETEIWSLCDSTFFRPFQKSILERILPSFLPWYWSRSLRFGGIQTAKDCGTKSWQDVAEWWMRQLLMGKDHPLSNTHSISLPFSLSLFTACLARIFSSSSLPVIFLFIPSSSLPLEPKLFYPVKNSGQKCLHHCRARRDGWLELLVGRMKLLLILSFLPLLPFRHSTWYIESKRRWDVRGRKMFCIFFFPLPIFRPSSVMRY